MCDPICVLGQLMTMISLGLLASYGVERIAFDLSEYSDLRLLHFALLFISLLGFAPFCLARSPRPLVPGPWSLALGPGPEP